MTPVLIQRSGNIHKSTVYGNQLKVGNEWLTAIMSTPSFSGHINKTLLCGFYQNGRSTEYITIVPFSHIVPDNNSWDYGKICDLHRKLVNQFEKLNT